MGDSAVAMYMFAAWLPRVQSHWMSDPAVSGGGWFIDAGSHHAWPGRAESSATVHVRQDSARAAGAIQLEPSRFILTLVGIKGSLHYDYDCPTTELLLRPNDAELSTAALVDAVQKAAHNE